MSAPPYVMRSENEKILWSNSRFIYEKITFDLCKCLCFQVPVPIISVLNLATYSYSMHVLS